MARAMSTLLPLAAGGWLLAAGPVRAQEDLDADVRQALDKARPALLAHLREVSKPDARPGELALVLLAAVHDGVEAGDRTFDAAVERLAKAKPDQTYDLALRLTVLEALPTFPDRLALAKADTRQLLQCCGRSGGFGYSKADGGGDLSNTQYGALGLRAGAALGVDIERAVWQRLAEHTGGLQDAYGGFGYTRRLRLGNDATASMTAAGIAVLAICRQQLGARPELDRQIDRGWQWFAKKPQVVGEPRTPWCLYFHYGLERAAILTDVTTVAAADWYAAGARMLVQKQLPGGGWRSPADGHNGTQLDRGRGDSVPTAFAVLFLRRKFQKEVAAVTPHVVRLVNLGPRSPARDVDACAEQLVARGKPAVPEVLQALRSEVEPQRRAAAKALQGLAGSGFGYEPAGDAAANRDAIKAAELWWLRHR
ncbi:MAG: hypothetical protein KF830_06145 [Planctomycetes bacterium]|nr:hypothetical protein [Planctomycetota bacterium]